MGGWGEEGGERRAGGSWMGERRPAGRSCPEPASLAMCSVLATHRLFQDREDSCSQGEAGRQILEKARLGDPPWREEKPPPLRLARAGLVKGRLPLSHRLINEGSPPHLVSIGDRNLYHQQINHSPACRSLYCTWERCARWRCPRGWCWAECFLVSVFSFFFKGKNSTFSPPGRKLSKAPAGMRMQGTT